MGGWVLILALNIASSTPGEIRDVSLASLGGFTSKAACAGR